MKKLFHLRGTWIGVRFRESFDRPKPCIIWTFGHSPSESLCQRVRSLLRSIHGMTNELKGYTPKIKVYRAKGGKDPKRKLTGLRVQVAERAFDLLVAERDSPRAPMVVRLVSPMLRPQNVSVASDSHIYIWKTSFQALIQW